MKTLVISALAAVMALPAVAHAAPPYQQPAQQAAPRQSDRDWNNDRDRNDDRRGDQNDRRNDRNDRYDRSDYRGGYYMSNGRRYERVRGPAWRAPPGYYHRAWARGQRLAPEYRRVVVTDYRAYHLAAPPRGYQYVRVDNDVLLTAVASGIIGGVVANVFLNN
jgi:Ni/Co efflux regulator RcnB